MGGRWPDRCRPLLLERDTAEGNAEHLGAQMVKLVFFVFALKFVREDYFKKTPQLQHFEIKSYHVTLVYGKEGAGFHMRYCDM